MKTKIIIALIMFSFAACSQKTMSPENLRFSLFDNTPNAKLAKAVESENEVKIKEILKEKKVNIDLQEPFYKQTLLHLAIGNDKLLSTRVLLECGANINILDIDKASAINNVTLFPKSRKNSFKMLELLLKFGANVNDMQIKKKGKDTVYLYIPLMGAVDELACTKLLLDHGADVYTKFDGDYYVWLTVLIQDLHDEIFVAKYLIVDLKMAIPNPITFSLPNKKPLDIFHLLMQENFRGDVKKEGARKEILDYLKKIDFPHHGVYVEK